MRRSAAVLAGVLLIAGVASRDVGTVDSVTSASTPTFSKDVAPILLKHCATCHRPGQIAPMSLLSYAEVRPWAKAVRNNVANRVMPPWYADPSASLKFRNDRRLSPEEIDTIVAWVDGGSPKGDDSDLPPAPQFTDTWAYGPPDHVIEMPVEFDIPAEGELPVLRFYSKLPFEEDRYLEKVEMKPSNVAVVHHANVHFQSLKIPEGARFVDGGFVGPDGQEITPEGLRGGSSVFDVDQGQLISYVPGRGYEAYPPGVGKVLPAGQWLVWSVHYTATGKPEKDRVRIGLYFSKEPVRHVVVTSQISGTLIVEGKELVNDKETGRVEVPPIPPYAENWWIRAIMPVQEDITLHGFQPHAHLRSQEWKYVVTYPDGKEEVLLTVPNYSFEWQLHYELAEPKKIPAGSRLMAFGRYDNSLKNRYNPGPDKKVYWSEQSWDEMFQPKIEYSIDRLERKVETPTTRQREQ